MTILVKTVPHKLQIYNTCGYWHWTEKSLEIQVSDTGEEKYFWLILIHELVEALICKAQGISEAEVDKFDMDFERNRQVLTLSTAEPGDHPKCPYRFAHCIATGVERVVAAVIGVNWSEYECALNSL